MAVQQTLQEPHSRPAWISTFVASGCGACFCVKTDSGFVGVIQKWLSVTLFYLSAVPGS